MGVCKAVCRGRGVGKSKGLPPPAVYRRASDDREFQEQNGGARYRAHYLDLQEEFVEEPDVGEYGPYWLLPVEEWAVTKERKVQRC